MTIRKYTRTNASIWTPLKLGFRIPGGSHPSGPAVSDPSPSRLPRALGGRRDPQPLVGAASPSPSNGQTQLGSSLGLREGPRGASTHAHTELPASHTLLWKKGGIPRPPSPKQVFVLTIPSPLPHPCYSTYGLGGHGYKQHYLETCQKYRISTSS